MSGYWPLFIVSTGLNWGGGSGAGGSIGKLLFRLTIGIVVNFRDTPITTLVDLLPETYWKCTVFRCILLSLFILVLVVFGMIVLFILVVVIMDMLYFIAVI